MSSDTGVRKVLQEIVDARLGLLPVSEHTGHLYVHFKAGRVRTVEWRTLDNPDEGGGTERETVAVGPAGS